MISLSFVRERESFQMPIIELLRNSCHLLEFSARLLLVNIPSYLLAKSPEVDRISSITFAYLTFQVVGLCWVFLVNAAFALATRVTTFLPPMNLANDTDQSVIFNAATSDAAHLLPSPLSSPYTSVQLIATFYVSYASIRVVVSFAQSVFHIALESIKDFPDAALVLARGGIFTLQLTPIVFVPALFLQSGLICADYFCSQAGDNGILTGTVQGGICNHTGLFYLTSAYPEVRKLVFYAVIVMVLQIWQAHLHQFPRWDLAFKGLSTLNRFLYQFAVLLLTLLSLAATGLVVILKVEMSSLEAIVCVVLLGWTVWLFSFTPILVATHGQVWACRVTPQSVQHLAAYLRISHMIVLALMFSFTCFNTGFVQAQLEMTFATIFIPALYCCFFLLASACIRAGRVLLMAGVPSALILSLSITLLLAQSGGKGGVILVFLHILGKIIHFFGDEIDDTGEGSSDGWMGDGGYDSDQKSSDLVKNYYNPLSQNQNSGNFQNQSYHGLIRNRSQNSSYDNISEIGIKEGHLSSDRMSDSIDDRLDELSMKSPVKSPMSSYNRKERKLEMDALSYVAESKGKIAEHRGEDWSTCEIPRASSEIFLHPDITPMRRQLKSMSRMTSHNSISNGLLSHGNTSTNHMSGEYKSRASSDALQLLSDRGKADSSFVSLGLPKSVNSHWAVKVSQRNMSYIGQIARAITMSDSILTGILRAFVTIAAVFTLILVTLSVASVAQQNLQFFPRSFDFEIGSDGSVLFDHKIVNVTLYPRDLNTKFESPVPRVPELLSSLLMIKNSDRNLGDNGKENSDDNRNNENKIVKSTEIRHSLLGKSNPYPHTRSRSEKTMSSYEDGIPTDIWKPQKKPHYAACSWEWHGLSLFDFALFSEVAYFDERQGNQVQELVSTLLPDSEFKVQLEGRRKDLSLISPGGRPMYLELTSEKLGVTILAIRGTDVGRLHDFMEDIKMFAEPVLFTMLSGIFPTIRLWSQDTTSRVIEWMFNFNSFFGLQGEADYYKPLTQRIFEIIESSNNSVILTGHSLGGGLARIVGTLTELPSVSFSPPGLALSYRKYSATRPDGSHFSIMSKGAMHHESISVITEFDWYILCLSACICACVPCILFH